MPKVGLLIFPFWTTFCRLDSHFGWTPRVNYTVHDSAANECAAFDVKSRTTHEVTMQ